jgi:hypothetical protein
MGLVAGDPPNCPAQQLNTCHSQFNTDLGLSDLANWNNAILFNQELMQIVMSDGTSGVLKICRAFVDFHTCLGQYWYDCTSPEYFVGFGYNYTEVELWSMTFREYHFTCGSGFNAYINNWDCYVSMFTDPAKNASLMKCFQEYDYGLVIPAEQCGVANGLLTCVQVELQRYCNIQLGFAYCETIRQGLQIPLYYCDTSCTSQVDLIPIEPPEKKAKLENYIRNPVRDARFAASQ